MNKFGFAIILIAAYVCAASAAPNGFGSKKHSKHLEEDFDEGQDEEHHLGRHGHHERSEDEQSEHFGHPDHSKFGNKFGHKGELGQKQHGHNEQDREHEQLESHQGHLEHQGHQGHLGHQAHQGHQGHLGHQGHQGHQGHLGHSSHKHGHLGHLGHKLGHKQHGHKQHGHKHQEEEEENDHPEHPIGHKHHQGHKQHGHKKHGHKHQGHLGHQGHQGHHEQQEDQEQNYGKHGGFKHTIKGGHKNGNIVRQGGVHAFNDREVSQGGLAVQDDERDRIHADQQQFGNKIGAKGIVAGKFSKNKQIDTGLKAHQKFNNDKTIIKDKSSGSQDIEVNRQVNRSKDAHVVAAGRFGAETEASNTNIDAERERDRDLVAGNTSFKDREAAHAEFNDF